MSTIFVTNKKKACNVCLNDENAVLKNCKLVYPCFPQQNSYFIFIFTQIFIENVCTYFMWRKAATVATAARGGEKIKKDWWENL